MILNQRLLIAVLVFAWLLAASVTTAADTQLTFEDRVRAQGAIERVYHAHRIDATIPFEQKIGRATLEQKVWTYLRQSAALDEIGDLEITAQDLRDELRRIVRQTRFPGRLAEMFAALNHDPVLIHETLVRPVIARKRIAAHAAAHDSPEWWRSEVEYMSDESLVQVDPDLATATLPESSSVSDLQCLGRDAWFDIAEAEQLPRKYHTAVWTGSEMIVWGGVVIQRK